MAPPIINKKVAFMMVSLCIYGILLFIISNKNISPYAYIMSSFSDPDTNNLTTPVVRVDIPPTKMPNLTMAASLNATAPRQSPSVTSSTTRSSTSSTRSSTSATSSSTSSSIPTTTTPEPIQPLLTMFTTFKNTPTKEHIYKNTIHNWALLHPYVKPVMYVIPGEIDLKEYGRPLGWDSHFVPKTSSQGVPVLRHMFLHAQSKYNSTFYGYANGDIIFTKDLVDSLIAIAPYENKIKKMLLVGRRTNCQMKVGQEIRSLEEVSNIIKTGKVFNTNAQDYFISTRNGYPWDTIPDFVVGRVGYDNWLVVTALTKGMAVIDMSQTVSAMHQTGTDGNMAGHSKKPKGDTYINYGLAGSKFDYSLGHVSCSQFYTKREEREIIVAERKKNGCEKLFKKYRKNPYLKLPSR